jgi:hypothetical protein
VQLIFQYGVTKELASAAAVLKPSALHATATAASAATVSRRAEISFPDRATLSTTNVMLCLLVLRTRAFRWIDDGLFVLRRDRRRVARR